MEEACRLTIGFEGAPCRTDVKTVRFPDRYGDEDGVEMFERIVGELPPMELTREIGSVTL
jgi:hypothetical protein